jgi:hypothetical protein
MYIFRPKNAQRRNIALKTSVFIDGKCCMTTETGKNSCAAVLQTIFVSANLTTIAVPSDPSWGVWLQLPDIHPGWHRRLDDQAHLWLRHAIRTATQTGRLPAESSAEAQARLQIIRDLGVQHGQLTAAVVDDPFSTPASDWQWAAGLPDVDGLFCD